jgi:hypothetical protein
MLGVSLVPGADSWFPSGNRELVIVIHPVVVIVVRGCTRRQLSTRGRRSRPISLNAFLRARCWIFDYRWARNQIPFEAWNLYV